MMIDDKMTCERCWKFPCATSEFNNARLCEHCFNQESRRFMKKMLEEFQGDSAF